MTIEFTPCKTPATNEANVLKTLAKGSDLEALLNHSANDLRDNPSLENFTHVQELITILSK